jgi:hypothetical protein
MWFIIALTIIWIAVTIVVGWVIGWTERIMAAGTGRICGASECPPSMEILPKEYVVFHPAFDAGFVVGFSVVAAVLVAWRSLGRLSRDDVSIE